MEFSTIVNRLTTKLQLGLLWCSWLRDLPRWVKMAQNNSPYAVQGDSKVIQDDRYQYKAKPVWQFLLVNDAEFTFSLEPLPRNRGIGLLVNGDCEACQKIRDITVSYGATILRYLEPITPQTPRMDRQTNRIAIEIATSIDVCQVPA